MRDKDSPRVAIAVLLLFTVLGSTLVFLPPPAFAQVGCGATITANTILSANVGPCSGNGLVVGANHIVLNCAGHTISGLGTDVGISLIRITKATVKNCKVTGFEHGFSLKNSSDNTLSKNTAKSNNNNGFVLNSSSNSNKLIGNTTKSNNNNGFYLDSSSSSNTLTRSRAKSNGHYGFYDDSTGSGTKGTANFYASNVCKGNVFGGSSPSGLGAGCLRSGIAYPTMADELLNKGFTVWEFDMYFPSIGLAVTVDLIEGSTSCPCHMTGLTQVGNTVQVISAGQENITIVPSTGYRKLVIDPTETMSTAWNGTPDVRPNDVYQMWQQNYSVVRFSGMDVPAGFFAPDNVGFNSWGKAALTRNGATYWGVGNYWRITASSGYDPHIVAGLSSIYGAVSTPSFLLSTQKIVYTGGQYGTAFVQDLSEVAYRDGSVYPVQINETGVSCTGETISFTDPRTSAVVTVILTFVMGRQNGCLNGHPGGELPAIVGGASGYYGWVRIHPAG